MSITKAVFGILLGGSIAAAIFFGIQYAYLRDSNDTIATLKDQNSTLKIENNALTEQNKKLRKEITGLQRTLLKVVSESQEVLGRKTKEFEKELQRLSQPPVSPDASTPWERLTYSFDLLRTGKYGEYWKLLNSEFKTICPKENFEKLLLGIKPTPGEPIFIDGAVGNTRAMVWLSVDGRIYNQLLLLENREWVLYAGTKGC